MNFIKKIFDGKSDESVHLQFQKFGKGEFKDRALIHAKNSGGKYSISTSAEFANEIVRIIAEKNSGRKTKVSGAIVSTSDLTWELKFKEKKQFQGVKKYLIEDEMSGNDILELLEKFPKAFFALSFDSSDSKLKIKPKVPKSGKPNSMSKETSKPDFCKLLTSDKELGKSFVFENPDFKNADIKHDFFIDELIFPKNEKDFAKIREMAKRKGKIIRRAKIDDKEITSEKEFEA